MPTATSRSPQHPHGRRYDGQVVVYAFPRLAVGTQDGRLSLAHEGSSGRYQVYRRCGPGQARRPSASASAPASGSVPVAGAAAVASTAARLLLTELVFVIKSRPACAQSLASGSPSAATWPTRRRPSCRLSIPTAGSWSSRQAVLLAHEGSICRYQVSHGGQLATVRLLPFLHVVACLVVCRVMVTEPRCTC